MKKVRAIAPPTIANVGPGFDMFGLALDMEGDSVEARTNDNFKEGVNLVDIIGNDELPSGHDNVVQAAGQKVYGASEESAKIQLTLFKKMGIGTGLGSSASSSVAGALAVNHSLYTALDRDDPIILEAIVHGEAVATNGLGHADNVLPSLLGGFIIIHDPDFVKKPTSQGYTRFETPHEFYFTVASPDISLNTGDMRRALKDTRYDIPGLVNLASKTLSKYLLENKFYLSSIDIKDISKSGSDESLVYRYINGAIDLIDGVRDNNPKKMGEAIMTDLIITPVRAEFIPGYYDVREAALKAGAYGFSIAGSGPSVFSVTDEENKAYDIGMAMSKAFEKEGVTSRISVSKINNQGAKILD